MSTTSQTLHLGDPRARHDDPLLDSLLSLCALHQRPASRAMLSAGLPLPAQRLTAELLPRAAARAGLQGRWLQRPLRQIPAIALPALLLLKEGRAAILLAHEGERGRSSAHGVCGRHAPRRAAA